MRTERAANVEALIREIQRYLAYVDALRRSSRSKRRNGERSSR
jgi:hypothetical protein